MAVPSTSRGYVQTTASNKNATPTKKMAMTSRGNELTVVCNDIAKNFSEITRTSTGDVTTAATDSGMLTNNDEPDTGTTDSTIHTAHRIMIVIIPHGAIALTSTPTPTPTTTTPPL